jgi:translation initiation factor 1
MGEQPSRLVYSTDGEHIVSRKPSTSAKQANAAKPATQRPPEDGIVRVQRQKSGRRGKTVTVITGLPGGDADLDAALKLLKQHCGAGGTRAGNTLEIQGDHRAAVQEKLAALGHRVKLSGG